MKKAIEPFIKKSRPKNKSNRYFLMRYEVTFYTVP